MSIAPKKFAIGAGWQCASILNELTCRQRYAALGNHDVMIGAEPVSEALTANGITVLCNSLYAARALRRPHLACGARRPLAGLAGS